MFAPSKKADQDQLRAEPHLHEIGAYERKDSNVLAYHVSDQRGWWWWRMVKRTVILSFLPQSTSSIFAFATNIHMRMRFEEGHGFMTQPPDGYLGLELD